MGGLLNREFASLMGTESLHMDLHTNHAVKIERIGIGENQG